MKRLILLATFVLLLAGLASAGDWGRPLEIDKSMHGAYLYWDDTDLIIGTAADTTAAIEITHFIYFASSYEVDMGQTCDSAVCEIYFQVSMHGGRNSDDWIDCDTFKHADDDTLYRIIEWTVPTARYGRIIKLGAQGANDSCYASMRHLFKQ